MPRNTKLFRVGRGGECMQILRAKNFRLHEVKKSHELALPFFVGYSSRPVRFSLSLSWQRFRPFPGTKLWTENSARFHFSKGFVFVDYDHEAGTWVNTDSFAFSCRASAEKKDRAEGRGGRRRKEKRDGKSRGFDFNETREASRTNRD